MKSISIYNNDFAYLIGNFVADGSFYKDSSGYRFKKSKVSMNSVKLPTIFDDKLLKLARFVRIRNGSISFSKAYTLSFNENFDEILEITRKMFGINPKYTCKNEPLFCSGVLSDLFKAIIIKEN